MQCRGLFAIIVAIIFIYFQPFAAQAAIINGSFETGTFAGWNTIGDTSIQTSSIGIAPTDGTSMALLTTLCDSQSGAHCETILRELPFSATSAVPSTVVTEGFFGFTSAEINTFIPREVGPPTAGFPLRGFPAGEGSGIKQTVTGNAGDILSFDFYYVTNEGVLNGDQAFFALIPTGGGPKVLMFLNPLTGQGSISPVDLCNRQVGSSNCAPSSNRTTDWQHVAFALPSHGTFTAGFGMWEVAEGTVPSALFIDNVQLTSVPGPSTLVLLGVGLAGAASLRRRKVG
jgi:PEP-CTERM motif